MSKVTSGGKLAIHGGERAVPEGLMKKWPPIGELDRKLVLEALEGGTHTCGKNYKELEKEFADWLGIKNSLFCNSGTGALHMALVACEVGCGDEVIVPAYTWPSSATCCIHHNAIPVFVDIEWTTMNIDAAKIESAITARTKAIIAVHLHGLSVDMDSVIAVARKHNLKVIEDCCQAHGTTYRGKRVGLFGDVASFSCNQNKCHCSGEGGFFCSNDDEMFERGKKLWYFGEHRKPETGKQYNAYGMGWMYRSTELVAAFARAQLTRLDEYLFQIKANAERLHEQLKSVPNLILPVVPAGHGHNWYNYTVRFDMDALGHADDAANFRDKLVKAINAEGAETGVWQGWPVPEMTAIAGKNAYGKGCPWECTGSKVNYDLSQFPVAIKHCGWHTGMTMPLRPPNGTELVERVAEAFRKVMTSIDQVEKVQLQSAG
jgi:dTDP-4-amino-4,6-dideoxygalactose transaminase